MRASAILFSAILTCVWPAPAALAEDSGQPPILTPCFEPDEDCIGLLVSEIDGAEREVLAMTYGFTSPRVADAFARAAERGVRVRVIVDRRRNIDGVMRTLPGRDVEVLTDPVDVQHNKVVIVDRRRLVTGSQNFTRGSQNNAENTIVILHPPTVRAYVDNWLHRADQTRAYRAPDD